MTDPPTHLAGAVVHGAGRGRHLGFPTANLATDPDTEIPPSGVYCGWVVRPATGTVHPGTISVGTNPTFCETTDVHVEVYCHDTSGDFYGERLAVWFVSRIRDTVRFASPDDLVRAAHRDVRHTEDLLASDHGRRALADVLATYRATSSTRP